MDEELERFKRLKLHEYAASLGYELDARETSRRETVMRKGGDKISIRMDADGHYVFYSFRDEGDHGTILDFVMRRQGKNFGEARKVLRTWTGTARVAVFQHLEEAPRGNRDAVAAEYKAMKELRWHDYLEQERKLPRSVLLAARFRGRIRVDARSNAIFPHEDEAGLCGFEKRNRNFKGFGDLGEKGLWTSNAFPEDRCLVIGESAIDCISYEVLFPGGRYASIAGGLNPKQPDLISQACKAMPVGSEVVSVTHGDAEGERYAEVIREKATEASLPFRVHRPQGVKDWNDVLKAAEPGLYSFPAGH
jgi:Toprim-like/Protein of unknown function (DUF3991)